MNPIYALTTLVIGNNRIERTALNKLMFFAEALHIIEHDMRISDVPYLKCEYGPVPEGMRMIRARLVNSEWIAEEAKDNGSIIQFFYTATEKGLKEARKALQGSALDVATRVSNRLGGAKPFVLSRASHEVEPWVSHEWGDDLDMSKVKTDKKLVAWIKKNELVEKQAAA